MELGPKNWDKKSLHNFILNLYYQQKCLSIEKINEKIRNFIVDIDKKFIYILKAKIERKSN